MPRYLTAALLVCFVSQVPAQNHTVYGFDAERYARERVTDIEDLLLGPTAPHPRALTSTDCAGLYAQRLDLLRAGLDHRVRFSDDPRHSAASFVGTIWTPAFYFLPFRAIAETTRTRHARERGAGLDRLREASAQLRCFER